MFKILTLAMTLLVGLASCGDSGKKGEIMTVASERVDCHGVMPMKCMVVKMDGSDEWTLFYNEIEGFEYTPGYEYELRVEKTAVIDPPADASALKYRLLDIVSMTEKQSEGLDRFRR